MASKTANLDLNCLTISELEAIAHDKMDKQTRDYYNEGADSGSTLRENLSAYNKYRIRPRVLRDVSTLDPSIEIFGHKNSSPFGVAPTAMQCLAHSDGEIGTANACRDMGIAMGLSSFATKTLEEVAEEEPSVRVCLWLALAHAKGGLPDGARRWLARAAEEEKNETGRWSYWARRLEVQALRREVEGAK